MRWHLGYRSIGLEMSPDTHERSYLASSKDFFQVGGAILASLIPVLVASKLGVSLQIIAIVALVLLAVGLFAFLTFVLPRGHAFPVLDLDGFNEEGTNEASQLATLVFFFAWLPAMIRILAFILLPRLKLQSPDLGRD